MRIYIAGPMSGIPYFNFPAFDDAEEILIHRGFQPFNPASNDRNLLGKPPLWIPTVADQTDNWTRWSIPNAPSLRKMLSDDLNWICHQAEAIFMLKGWESSKGARTEHSLAHALNLKIIYQ